MVRLGFGSTGSSTTRSTSPQKPAPHNIRTEHDDKMGMCMCTLIGCPAGVLTACCSNFRSATLTSHFPTVMVRRVDATEVAFFAAWLGATFLFLYLPLTFLCAVADGSSWKLYPYEGECWSEGGSMPYVLYGLLVGLSMGFGLTGLIVAAIRTLCGMTRKTPQNTTYDVVETEIA
jgi:hypothetical protein